MVSVKKNPGFYQQLYERMHVIFNGTNVDGKQIWELERFDVPKKSNGRLK